MFEPVFLTVIINELFASRNVYYGAYKYASFGYVRFAIGSARVVDIARRVFPWLSVYGLISAHLKEVLAAAAIFFFLRYEAAHVFDYARTFRNRFSSIKPEPCIRTLHRKSFRYGSLTGLFRALWCSRRGHATASIPCAHQKMTVVYSNPMTETTLSPNAGKTLEGSVAGTRYVRLPIKTPLVMPGDDLFALLDEYVKPHLKPGDLLFVSEKIVCICQNRVIRAADVKTSWLARLLSRRVRNHVGTPQFRGYGHGTAPAMQLLIDEAGYPRALFAALAAAVTRPLGVKGAFYYLVGKQAKSIDCPMSFTLEPFKDFAKRAPRDPNGVAQALKARYGVETVIVDANYRGAFFLGRSTRTITDAFIVELLKDNPAGQDSEMTPFLVVRKA